MNPELRKKHSEEICTQKGVKINEALPLTEDAANITLKAPEVIARKAAATLLTIQMAFEMARDAKENVKFYADIMKQYDLHDEDFNELETFIRECAAKGGKAPEQAIVDTVWEYECYWALLWAAGIVDDITNAEIPCDVKAAVGLLKASETIEDFISRVELRSADDILDMFDLYYRYHCACVDKQANADTPIGDLKPEVVFERRRGLEWLISEETDWHKLPLDT